jgi:hypothetical protein
MDDRDDNEVFESFVRKLAALQRKLNDMSGHADTAHRAHIALDKAYKRIKELEAEVADLRGANASVRGGAAAPYPGRSVGGKVEA